MNPSLQQLAVTLLFVETDNADSTGGEPLDANFGVSDIDPDSLALLYKRFSSFVSEAENKIASLKGQDWTSIEDFYTGCSSGGFQLEHDYIMTTQECGCGFWEKHDWEPAVGELLTALARKSPPMHCFVEGGTIYIEVL
jgi:hypothetical protein